MIDVVREWLDPQQQDGAYHPARASSVCLAWEGLSHISEADTGMEGDVSGLTEETEGLTGDEPGDTLEADVSMFEGDSTLEGTLGMEVDETFGLENLVVIESGDDTFAVIAKAALFTNEEVSYASQSTLPAESSRSIASIPVSAATTPRKQSFAPMDSPARSIFSHIRFSAHSIKTLSSFASRRARTPVPSPASIRPRPPLPKFETSVLPKKRSQMRSVSRLVARQKLKARAEAHAEAEEKERVLMAELERVGTLRPRRVAGLKARGLLGK